jgi:hypothetical protein
MQQFPVKWNMAASRKDSIHMKCDKHEQTYHKELSHHLDESLYIILFLYLTKYKSR